MQYNINYFIFKLILFYHQFNVWVVVSWPASINKSTDAIKSSSSKKFPFSSVVCINIDNKSFFSTFLFSISNFLSLIIDLISLNQVFFAFSTLEIGGISFIIGILNKKFGIKNL